MSAKLTGLYLKGVSTGQFEEALAALLGTDAPGLSAATVRRLTEAWQEEHERWQGAISPAAATSISGPMGSTSPRDWSMSASACWC